MSKATLIYAVYDFTSASCWKGALCLKEMNTLLQELDINVMMASFDMDNLAHAQMLAARFQLPFGVTTIDLVNPQLKLHSGLKRHGDNALLLLDACGGVRGMDVACAPNHTINSRRILTCLRQMMLKRVEGYWGNGRIFPTHYLASA